MVPWRVLICLPCALSAALLLSALGSPEPPRLAADTLPAQIDDAEFWRLSTDFSEPDGDYPWDNWISNEDTVQQVIPVLKQIVKPGGAYIGVGPEQNFTYISALRPKVAFIVDIRRQNLLELFMYRALFELAPDRADFVALLFSRKRPAGLNDQTSPEALLTAYRNAQKADFAVNIKAIRSTLSRHGFRLSEEDLLTIDFIYQVFYRGGPTITSEFMASGSPYQGTPNFTQLMTANDGQGHNWSFLATEESFQYVRELQRKNLIIPVVGDFAGPKAIRRIAQYLKDHNSVVGAFYISNVEQYLQSPPGAGRSRDTQSAQLEAFFRSAVNLPFDSSSMVIRMLAGNTPKPLWSKGQAGQVMQLAGPMTDFARFLDSGRTLSYATALDMITDPATLTRASNNSSNRIVPGRIISKTGAKVPSITLPVSTGPGQPFSSIVVVPAPDGSFLATVPIGVIQIGAPTGLPPGVSIESILYGTVELLKDSAKVTAGDTSEFRITLGP